MLSIIIHTRSDAFFFSLNIVELFVCVDNGFLASDTNEKNFNKSNDISVSILTSSTDFDKNRTLTLHLYPSVLLHHRQHIYHDFHAKKKLCKRKVNENWKKYNQTFLFGYCVSIQLSVNLSNDLHIERSLKKFWKAMTKKNNCVYSHFMFGTQTL